MTGIDLQTQGHKSTAEALAEAHALGNGNNQQTPPIPALSASELARLGYMSKDELIALINRVSGAIWGIAMMSKDERIEAAKLKLWNAGLTQPDIFKALPALREALDRETGKPAQSIAMKVETDAISKLSDERLLRLERSLAQMTGEDAIIIAPLPGKLED